MEEKWRGTCEVDHVFGVGGRLELQFPGVTVAEPKAMTLSGQRLLLLVKLRIGLGSQAAVAGLSCTGQIDSAFADHGFLTAPFGAGRHIAPVDLLTLRSGALLLVGQDHSQGYSVPLVARYHPDGSRDLAFGAAGIVTLRLNAPPVSDQPFAAVELADGGLLIAMTRLDEDENAHGVLVRLRADGQLDERFHAKGCFVFSLPDASPVWFEGVMQQADGKVMAWGSAGANGLLLRLGLDDQPDLGFAGRGYLQLGLAPIYGHPGVLVHDVIEDASGALLVAGANARAPYAGVLTRVTSNGTLDPRFNGGMIRADTAIAEGSRWLRCFSQADGDIVVAGQAGVPYKGEDTRFLLGRYRADGGLDSRYGEGTGWLASNIDQGADIATCALAWGDRRLLLAGVCGAGVDARCCVMAYQV